MSQWLDFKRIPTDAVSITSVKDGLVYSFRSIRKNALPATGRWFVLAWHELKEDSKKTRWWRGFAWFWLFCLFGGLIAVLTVTPFVGVGLGNSNGCNPDGSFSMDGDYNVWLPSNVFEVTLRSGEYGFAAVKIIDVVWDVAVGRGGQAVLAYITYIVLTRFMTFQMTQAPIAIPVYKRVFMEPELGLRSTFCLLWDFFKYRPLSSPLGMAWIILTSIFIVIFPTWTSAMTSYTPSISPFVKNSASNLVPYDDTVKAISYVIHDGDRLSQLNMTKDFVIARGIYSNSLMESYIRNCDAYFGGYSSSLYADRLAQYVKVHGFRGLSNATSVFMNVTLDPPTLNIDASYFEPDSNLYGYNWKDPETGQYPFRTKTDDQFFSFDGGLVTRAYLDANGRCQPANDTFQWGFSFLLLFVLSLILILWGLATYLIWLQAHLALRYVEPTDEVAGEYAAAFRMVAAMREDFKTIGQEKPDHMTEAEIKRQLRYTLGGGRIEQATRWNGDGPSVREIRIAHMNARLEQHKWWSLAWFLTTGVGASLIPTGGIPGIFFGTVFCSASFGIMLSGFFGWRSRPRLLLTGVWTLIGFIIAFSLRYTIFNVDYY